MPAANTSGERRALSDHADVILNDTEDGVAVVIENRDKVPYILDFNFSQTENMTLSVATADGARSPDPMKVSIEIAGGAVKHLCALHVINDDVTSLTVSYRVRCRIRNTATGAIEKCPTARNQELDVPEVRIKMSPTVDLIAKQAPSGYVCYLENKGGSPTVVSVDFSPSTNFAVSPLDTRVKMPDPSTATIAVPANGTVEFVEVGPKARGPFHFAARPSAKLTQPTPSSPAPSRRAWPQYVPPSKTDVPKTIEAISTVPIAVGGSNNNNKKPTTNSDNTNNNAVDNDGFDEFDGGAGEAGIGTCTRGIGGADDDKWDTFGGGAGSIGGGGGGDAWESHDGGAGGGGGGGGSAPGWKNHDGGAGGGVGGGVGSSSPASSKKAEADGAASPDVSAHGAGGPAAGQNQFVNDDYLVKTFPNIHKDFGPKGANDGSPNCKDWTAYRWVLKEWEEERLARIKLEAEWRVRYQLYLKQWHQSVCNICRNLVVEGLGLEVVSYKEYKLHRGCFDRADKCDVCAEILVGEYVVAKGAGGGHNTKLHAGPCVDEYRKRSRPKCYICSKQIMEDRWGTSAGQPYHLSCKK